VKKETKEKLFTWSGTMLIRLLGSTLRIRMNDEGDFLTGKHPAPFLLAFWHNRLLAMPMVFIRHYRNRKGVAALISSSRDGRMISDIIRRLGYGVVNGSSSRRAASATLELVECIQSGKDVGITPDGPRGPRYKLNSGLIFLAQKTGAPILPVHVEYSRCIRFNSWDRFMVPLPFSRVDIHFGKIHHIPENLTKEEFEAERARIENVMQPATL